MNSLHSVAVLVAVVALLGSIGIGTSLQQQVFAQKEQLTRLIDEFEKAVLDEADDDPPEKAVLDEADDVLDEADDDPPEPDKIQRLIDEYNRNLMRIFDFEPPDPDLEPPDPDTETNTR